VAPTAQVELSKGVLNAETLKVMTARTLEYSFRLEFDKKMEIAVVTGSRQKDFGGNEMLMRKAKELGAAMEQFQLAN